MKHIIQLLVAIASSTYAVEDNESNSTLELYVFGKSYHSNRSYNWNENNYGLGIGIDFPVMEDLPFTIMCMGGVYKDSYNEYAKFMVLGPRYTIGNTDAWHSSFSVGAGPFYGSDFNGLGYVGIFALGYEKISICITGSVDTGPAKEGATSTNMIATFLKIRLMEF